MLFVLVLVFSIMTFADEKKSEICFWQQIQPQINQRKYSNSTDQALHACTTFALTQHGSRPPLISQEYLQTISSLRLLSLTLPQIAHNHLNFGYFALAQQMCCPTDNTSELNKKKELVSYLQNNPALQKSCDDILKKTQECERLFLWNYYPKQTKTEKDSADVIEKLANFDRQISNTIYGNRYVSEVVLILGCLTAYQMARYAQFQACNYSKIKEVKRKEQVEFFALSVNETWAESFVNNSIYPDLGAATAIIFTMYQAASSLYSLKKNFDAIYQQSVILTSLSQLLHQTKKLDQLLKQHPIIAKHISQIQTISNFANLKNLSSEMHSLCKVLLSNSYKKNANYFISWHGKTTETFTSYQKVINEFIPLWQALGELDAHLCIQKLLSQQHGTFCIPTWTESPTPSITMSNYWHPSLDFTKAVCNNMALGSLYPRNAIVTGANAGGKTTALTAIMTAQILAQSLSVAPASSMVASPFAKFQTYLDISTDLAAAKSLFVAQADRARDLYTAITTCNSNQKTLSILDEIFTGTRADFAEQASYDFAQKLGAIAHSVCLIATHFPKLTELEKLKTFINYKAADATINNYGELVYPYKIIPGISTQNIALHILKQKGLLFK